MLNFFKDFGIFIVVVDDSIIGCYVDFVIKESWRVCLVVVGFVVVC